MIEEFDREDERIRKVWEKFQEEQNMENATKAYLAGRRLVRKPKKKRPDDYWNLELKKLPRRLIV